MVTGPIHLPPERESSLMALLKLVEGSRVTVLPREVTFLTHSSLEKRRKIGSIPSR